MKKFGASLLILLMLGPTLALACSCCPMAHAQVASALEISAPDCCCSSSLAREDSAAEWTNSSFIFSNHFSELFLFGQAVPSKEVEFNRPFTFASPPPHLEKIPLYLSNLVLRF